MVAVLEVVGYPLQVRLHLADFLHHTDVLFGETVLRLESQYDLLAVHAHGHSAVGCSLPDSPKLVLRAAECDTKILTFFHCLSYYR